LTDRGPPGSEGNTKKKRKREKKKKNQRKQKINTYRRGEGGGGVIISYCSVVCACRSDGVQTEGSRTRVRRCL